MFPNASSLKRTAKSFTVNSLLALLPVIAAAQSGPNTVPDPVADTSGAGGAGQGQTPTPDPSSTVNPVPPRPAVGPHAPPAGIPITSGVTTGPLAYRPGDAARINGTPSVSEQLMDKLPHWIKFEGELRDRAEGYENLGFKPNSSDLYDLYRMHLGMLLQPANWIRFYIETSDERVFEKKPAIPPYQDTWDIKKAFVELGDPEAAGFGLRVGRQELLFGNGRFIGNGWWSNVERTFDGVKGSYEHNGYRADLFIVSVVIARDGVVDHHNEGNNLSGAYGTLKDKFIPHSQIEPFTFWHVQQGAALKNGKLGHLDQWTYGVRWLGTLPANFDYRTEMAIQRGELGSETIKAWTGHWTVGNTLPLILKPRPFVEYNYASGDPNSKNLNETQTFDPIYPSTHDKLGLADQIGWRNIRDLRGGLDLRPSKKWALNTSYHDFWLANAHDSLYPTRGSVVAKDPTGKSGTHVGTEFDAQATYKPTLQTEIGAGIGHLMDGRFLKDTTKGKDYTYPYFLADYVF